jgi:hypothetical protein
MYITANQIAVDSGGQWCVAVVAVEMLMMVTGALLLRKRMRVGQGDNRRR